jgi:nucleotide-binding universal stress UspA family protein
MSIKRIMLATDFSPQARHALDVAAELSARLQVPLLVVSAFQIPMYPLPEGAFVAGGPAIAEIVDRVSRDLAAEKKLAVERGAHEVDTLVVEGPPAIEIVRLAKERAIDLIVLGSHGRGGITRALLGSVADRVVRTAPCPVTVVAH